LIHGQAIKLTVSIHFGHNSTKSNAYEPILFVKKVLYNEEYRKSFLAQKLKKNFVHGLL
jgi:hypothetical protein